MWQVLSFESIVDIKRVYIFLYIVIDGRWGRLCVEEAAEEEKEQNRVSNIAFLKILIYSYLYYYYYLLCPEI